MPGLMLGISVSDFSPDRGHTAAAVYHGVDYIEYGGNTRPCESEEVSFALSVNKSLKFSRHLVSTELANHVNYRWEVDQIRADSEGFECQYYLTDVGFWSLGGRREGNIWPRPCSLDLDIAERVRANCMGLKERLGVGVLPENPAIISVRADITMAEFMAHIGQDLEICLDVGHFWSFCQNFELDLEVEIEKLPLASVVIMHIAGLTKVEFAGRNLFLDNHDVIPNDECIKLLHELLNRCPRLRWITYEAEMASTEVQLAGLKRVREACRR